MSEQHQGKLPIHEIDSRAVLWNVPPEERAGRPLLVMMHGLGSHEGDLFGLNRFLPRHLVVASLRAPLEHGGGFAWFQSGGQATPGFDDSLLNASVRGVLKWLDELDFTPPHIALMGFSQGGCMTLQLIREAPDRFDYVLQLSGFVAPVEHEGDSALAAREPQMPVFWAHGNLDEVIPAKAIEHTKAWLENHTFVEAHRYQMEHTVSQEELADLVEFVTAQGGV